MVLDPPDSPAAPRRPRGRAGEREGQARDAAHAASKFSFAKVLRSRLQRAETSQWKELLVDYLAAVQARTDRVSVLHARDAPPAGDDDAVYAKLIEQVTSDGVSKSKHILLRVPWPEHTQETADAMAALCCVPVPPEEPELFAQELLAASTAPCTPCKPKLRTLKRRLHTLKARAAPGPSGWLSARIQKIADRPYGHQAILGFCAIVAGGKWTAEADEFWGLGLIQPVGQGIQAPTAPDDPPRRKLRPIGLSEVLLKLGETVLLDDLTPKARRVLEPLQMGASTPEA
jgi:hypothetical protein